MQACRRADRGKAAAERAAEAAARTAELRERRHQLAEGDTVTAENAAKAAAAADHQVDNDVKAHLGAADAHLDAAELSVKTGDPDQATEHRSKAGEDVVAARAAHHAKYEPEPERVRDR